MKKQLEKLTKSSFDKLFLNNEKIICQIFLDEGIIWDLEGVSKKELVESIFLQETLNLIEKELKLYSINTGYELIVKKEQYLDFYKHPIKQLKLYQESSKISQKESYFCKIGVKKEDNKVIDIKEFNGNKREIINFINENNRNYTVKYYHLKYNFVVSINNQNWMTPKEMVEQNIATRKDKI